MFAGWVDREPDYFEKNYNSIKYILMKQEQMLIKDKIYNQ
jgi:hypothetical protein